MNALQQMELETLIEMKLNKSPFTIYICIIGALGSVSFLIYMISLD